MSYSWKICDDELFDPEGLPAMVELPPVGTGIFWTSSENLFRSSITKHSQKD